MKAPRRLQRPRRWALRHLLAVKRRLHEQEFGAELARVNLEMSPKERRAYLAWMRQHSRRSGVPPQPSHSVAWLLDLERELARENPDLTPP